MTNPWELYESHCCFAKASLEIEMAWNDAKQLAPERPSSERAGIAERHVYRTLERWREVGALDTEPVAILRERVRKHFGCEGGWL